MSYAQVLDMPIRAFWSFNKQIVRIQAENDLRAIEVATGSQTSDGCASLLSSLKEEHGSPMVAIDNRRTKNATDELKAALVG